MSGEQDGDYELVESCRGKVHVASTDRPSALVLGSPRYDAETQVMGLCGNVFEVEDEPPEDEDGRTCKLCADKVRRLDLVEEFPSIAESPGVHTL